MERDALVGERDVAVAHAAAHVPPQVHHVAQVEGRAPRVEVDAHVAGPILCVADGGEGHVVALRGDEVRVECVAPGEGAGAVDVGNRHRRKRALHPANDADAGDRRALAVGDEHPITSVASTCEEYDGADRDDRRGRPPAQRDASEVEAGGERTEVDQGRPPPGRVGVSREFNPAGQERFEQMAVARRGG